jgi:hypothetical protein
VANPAVASERLRAKDTAHLIEIFDLDYPAGAVSSGEFGDEVSALGELQD